MTVKRIKELVIGCTYTLFQVHRLVTSGDPFIELIDTRLDPMNDELARIKIYLDVKQGQLGDPASIQKRIEALIPQIREIEEQV